MAQKARHSLKNERKNFKWARNVKTARYNRRCYNRRLSCITCKEKQPATLLHGYITKNKKVTGDEKQPKNLQE